MDWLLVLTAVLAFIVGVLVGYLMGDRPGSVPPPVVLPSAAVPDWEWSREQAAARQRLRELDTTGDPDTIVSHSFGDPNKTRIVRLKQEPPT